MAQELCRFDGYSLVELQPSELFPTLFAKNWFESTSAEKVRTKIVDELGYKQVSEKEIDAYARATRLNENHWRFGSGRRFLMNPIVRTDSHGEVISYCGPYSDTGDYGYEIGLWRDRREEDPKKESFPAVRPHPVAIKYRVLSRLVVKQLL